MSGARPVAWVAARRELRAILRREAPVIEVDPLVTSSARFLDLVERIDALYYNARTLGSPRWAMFDCIEMPGALVGLGRPAREVAPALLDRLDAQVAPDDLVPLGFAAAIPMPGEASWLLQGLASLDEAEADLGGMAALAAGLLGARAMTASSQWAARELAAYARFAPLGLRAAWQPAHDVPATCIFELSLDGGSPPTASLEIDPEDVAALQLLQRNIESGARVSIVGAPVERAGRRCVPLAVEGGGA